MLDIQSVEVFEVLRRLPKGKSGINKIEIEIQARECFVIGLD